MTANTLYHRLQRYRTLQSDRVYSLPVVVLMPHSACNCRCVMCDIWKDNANRKQLTEQDILSLLITLRKLGTQTVLMSGGEALLNPSFFHFCEILARYNIKVSLLSTGITLKKHAPMIVKHVRDVTVSLDGSETMHDTIRGIPGACARLAAGVRELREQDPYYPLSARTVIHRLNFRDWPNIIRSAIEWELNRISFLPADVSSHAFNREILWSDQRQQELLLDLQELKELKEIIEDIIAKHIDNNPCPVISENAERLRRIHQYYAAFHGLNAFPYKKCNAPWVSVVVEADGTVRPCFFHPSVGNIRQSSLEELLNSEESVRFRKKLDTNKDPICVKCVCYLHLSPGKNIV